MNAPAADAAPASRPSGLPSGYWQQLATTDFARLDAVRTIALLPVAAIEQHSPHLPLATDALINQGVVGPGTAAPAAIGFGAGACGR